jgi:GNAT superfamily N-acetyltransferase
VTDGVSTPSTEVRRAGSDEFDRLRWVELESDRLLATVDIGPFANDDRDRLELAAVIFAAGDPAVGFVSIELVDDEGHIAQLSVLPELGRQGVGRLRLDEAIRWAHGQGFTGATLTTCSDVPWNAPFYGRVGFVEEVDPATGLAAIREDERVKGLDTMGPRLAMRLAF